MWIEFARVYVLVDEPSVPEGLGSGVEEAPAYCSPCQLGKWVIYHDILPGRSLRMAVSAGSFILHAIDELKCFLKRILQLT
jgi:hypothetical protein